MKPIAGMMALLATFVGAPASADIADWLSGDWRTNARVTAPDGAQMRIRCTLDAESNGAAAWGGVLGCATVQGRFESRWSVAVTGGTVAGQVLFDGPESGELAVTGSSDASHMMLSSPDGQSVRFTPGPDGALVVEMQALGPQRLTGSLTFEPR